MTGPDHYREAERLAEQAEKLFGDFVDAHDEDGDTPDVSLIRRQAEHCREMGALHATLALAAATAMGAISGHDNNWSAMPKTDAGAWSRVAAVKEPSSVKVQGGPELDALGEAEYTAEKAEVDQ